MARHVYFEEEQRWPSRSQRFGWVVAVGVVIFIAYQLNLHLFRPVVAGLVLLLLTVLLLTVITIQQRLTVRIGRGSRPVPGGQAVRRVWRRAVRVVPGGTAGSDGEPQLVIQISYGSKGPISTLSPGRRGNRLGRRDCYVALDDIETWKADRLPVIPRLRRDDSAFPVGAQRDAVTIVLSSGERLTIPTRIPATFLEALSEAKVDAVKQRRGTPVIREEI